MLQLSGRPRALSNGRCGTNQRPDHFLPHLTFRGVGAAWNADRKFGLCVVRERKIPCSSNSSRHPASWNGLGQRVICFYRSSVPSSSDRASSSPSFLVAPCLILRVSHQSLLFFPFHTLFPIVHLRHTQITNRHPENEVLSCSTDPRGCGRRRSGR